MRSLKLMRAGTGNKNFFLYGLMTHVSLSFDIVYWERSFSFFLNLRIISMFLFVIRESEQYYLFDIEYDFI